MKEYQIIFIILIIIILFKVYRATQGTVENFRFNPIFYNDMDRNVLIRTGIIKKNIKLDKYGGIENANFDVPRAELGNKNCYTVRCPHWIKTGVCWKCD